MLQDVGVPEAAGSESAPDADFVARLELSLAKADSDRRRRVLLKHGRSALLVVLLAAPLLAWRLLQVSPGGTHAAIAGLARLAFLLNVGVHVDSAFLAYLGLQALPAVVGCLLFVLITAWLLNVPGDDS